MVRDIRLGEKLLRTSNGYTMLSPWITVLSSSLELTTLYHHNTLTRSATILYLSDHAGTATSLLIGDFYKDCFFIHHSAWEYFGFHTKHFTFLCRVPKSVRLLLFQLIWWSMLRMMVKNCTTIYRWLQPLSFCMWCSDKQSC